MSISNNRFINDANLQGYWKFDADGNDSSSRGYNLTAVGTPSYADAVFNNGAVLGSATPKYFHITDAGAPNLSITGSLTMIGRVNPSSLAAMYIMNKDSGVASGGGYAMTMLSTGALRFVYRDTGDANRVYDSASTAIVAGAMNFVAVSFDAAADTVIHRIGTNVGTTTGVTTNPKDNALNFSIGIRQTDLVQPFNGTIDDFWIFDRALTNAELDYFSVDSYQRDISSGVGVSSAISRTAQFFREISSAIGVVSRLIVGAVGYFKPRLEGEKVSPKIQDIGSITLKLEQGENNKPKIDS